MKAYSMLPLFLLAVLPLQCGRSEAPAPVSEGPEPSAGPSAKGVVQLAKPSLALAGIKVGKAECRQSKSVLRAMGKVLTPLPQKAIVGHAFPGRVAKIHVKIGDWVESRQPLITLESHEVGEAKAEFFKAQAEFELAKLTLAREERLLKEGIGVKKNHMAAETEFKVAEINSETAHRKLHVLGFSEEEVQSVADTHQISPAITLYSPIAGKVVELGAVQGGMVDALDELMTLIDPRLLWVDAEVYERDLAKIRIGQPVEITVPAYPGETFRGQVSNIGDVLDEETRTITVRTAVANDDLRLKPGMFADVCILRNGAEPTVLVPSSAVLDEGKQKIVFVRQNGKFARREVETRVVEGDCLQIVKGLAEGEEIVLQGNLELRAELQREVLEAAHTH